MTTKKNKNIPATDKIRSVIQQIGGHNYSDHEREQNDFYATSPEAIDRLFTEWQPPVEVPIWEPACGTGHLSLRLEELGYKVKSTDLIDRGFGEGGVDFLWQSDKWEGNIITNPPYDQATDFILHSLDLVPEGAYVAMFLKTLFVDSQSRYERLFRKTPPSSSIRTPVASSADLAETSVVSREQCPSLGLFGRREIIKARISNG